MHEREHQHRDRNYKKQPEQLKNIITELKNSIERFNIRLEQSEESTNSKTSNLKLSSQMNKKKKE